MPRGQGIKKLNQLFQKYRDTLKAPESRVINEAIDVIADMCSVTLTKENLSYQPHSRVVYLKTRALLKSEVIQHKSEILLHLKARLGEQNAPTDIR